MNVEIITGTGVPIYRQILDQVTRQINLGELPAGEELPPIRTLAERLVVNPNTVARAYLELARAGLVIKRQGAGTYVAEGGKPMRRADRLKQVTALADQLLAEADAMELDLDDVIGLVRKRSKKAGRR